MDEGMAGASSRRVVAGAAGVAGVGEHSDECGVPNGVACSTVPDGVRVALTIQIVLGLEKRSEVGKGRVRLRVRVANTLLTRRRPACSLAPAPPRGTLA